MNEILSVGNCQFCSGLLINSTCVEPKCFSKTKEDLELEAYDFAQCCAGIRIFGGEIPGEIMIAQRLREFSYEIDDGKYALAKAIKERDTIQNKLTALIDAINDNRYAILACDQKYFDRAIAEATA